MGKRTVAGRIVKESYGASKQQHTFTVSYINNIVKTIIFLFKDFDVICIYIF